MNTHTGYVAFIGKPNVGKSTLMNALLGEKISIVTHKPQTTRKRVLGILSGDDYQAIFLDTPGILKPSYLLHKKLIDHVKLSINDADMLVIIVDIDDDPNGKKTFEDDLLKVVLASSRHKKILVMNKIDKSNENAIASLTKKAEEMDCFDEIIPVSAAEEFNIDSVLNKIKEYLPEGPKFYPDDQLTDEPERFFVSEIIREKVFEQFKDEIPFSTEVMIDDFKERETGKDFIAASIIVERETQKPIIIGKRGDKIKRLGQIAREGIEQFLQRPVYLELHVKVKPRWRSNEQMLKNFGYDIND